MIKVLIADSHYLIREGLKTVIQSDNRLELVGEADNGESLLAGLAQHHPQVLILDYFSLQDFEIKQIEQYNRKPEVLVITSDKNTDTIRSVVAFGVMGFLFKDCDKAEIIDAVHAVAQSQRFYCNKVLDIVLGRQDQSDSGAEDCLPTSLSDRETEIVRLMALGNTTNEIAQQLSLSVHTIYTHRKNILRKLGLSSATDVVRYAIRTGLVGE